MRLTPTWRKAACLCVPVGLALASLLVPVQAHGPLHIAGNLPLIKYACGNRISQVYSQPALERMTPPADGKVSLTWVQALCEKQAPLTEAGFKLRPRLVTFLRPPVDAGGKGPNQGIPKENLAIYDFDVLYENLPVANASRMVVLREGKPVAIRDRNALANLQKPTSQIEVTYDTAWGMVYQNARETLGQLYRGAPPKFQADTNPASAPKLMVWPDAREKKMHLAWNLTVRSTSRSQPFIRRYWVAATQPARILDFEDLVIYQAPFKRFESRPRLFAPAAPLLNSNVATPQVSATAIPPAQVQKAASSFTALFQGPINGTVTGTMWETSPYGRIVSRPLPGLEVQVTRIGHPGQRVITNGNGHYQAQNVQGMATVRVNLNGHACRIIDESTKEDHALYFQRVGIGNVDVDFPAHYGEEFKLAQISAYYHVNQVHEYVREYLPERPSKILGLKTHVNINDSCNAYYDRSELTLNFFRSGGKECPNTSYRDVIFHEYGHAVDDELGGVLDGPYSEGFGDALAMLLTRTPIVAQDFYGPSKHLRDSRNVVLWSKTKDGEVHEAGQVYAGFCWELAQLLQSHYGSSDKAYEVAKQLIMGAAVQNPKDIPDAVRLSFFVDSQFYPNPRGGESLHASLLRAAARTRHIPTPQDSRFLNSPSVN
jgi:hypothetical protein